MKMNEGKKPLPHETTESHQSMMKDHHVGGDAHVKGLKDHGHAMADFSTRHIAEEMCESKAEEKKEKEEGPESEENESY